MERGTIIGGYLRNEPEVNKIIEATKEQIKRSKINNDAILVIDDVVGWSLDIARLVITTAVKESGLSNRVIKRNLGIVVLGRAILRTSTGRKSDYELDRLLENHQIATFHEIENIRTVQKNIAILKDFGRKVGEAIKEKEQK